MCPLIEELCNCYDYFFRLLGFLNLFDKVSLILLNVPYLIIQLLFCKSNVDSSRTRPPKKNCFIWFNESPLKMKNAFCFILKALFILKIFKFWSCRKNTLIVRKTSLISKFMTLQPV